MIKNDFKLKHQTAQRLAASVQLKIQRTPLSLFLYFPYVLTNLFYSFCFVFIYFLSLSLSISSVRQYIIVNNPVRVCEKASSGRFTAHTHTCNITANINHSQSKLSTAKCFGPKSPCLALFSSHTDSKSEIVIWSSRCYWTKIALLW